MLANLVHFGRVLRAAGLPIGPGTVIDAVNAVRAVGVADRQDFYWALHAVFVNRYRQRELFDQAFHVFWRNPRLLERMMATVLPGAHAGLSEPRQSIRRRLGEALGAAAGGDIVPRSDELELDAALTWSDREVLQAKDFEQMTREEVVRARAAVARMRLLLAQVPTRRYRRHRLGRRIDMRRSLRGALRAAAGLIPLERARRRRQVPPLVVVCDISGSMSRYSRMLLHFTHTLATDRGKVTSFVFATRLTNVTRYLREKDVDVALERISEAVSDWSGGTRIGTCLAEFNRLWSRRVLAQGAILLLITDGLDRDAGEGLSAQVERLHKSCRRLIWLNPLLRYADFEPRSLGMRAILPHVDEFRSVHNLSSLEALAEALSRSAPRTEEGVSQWLKQRAR
ncbi:MAG: VWA domain-containing protein [Gammaproteobacteria bacterium]|nr:VWA domain-containing protein [Gammaproteobacteria bacterium]